jgi:hypothetical protein
MTTLFDLQAADLTLSRDEVSTITGHARSQGQIDWLKLYKWHHHVNRGGEPVVGRLYATMKLSGVEVKNMVQSQAWTLDLASMQ